MAQLLRRLTALILVLLVVFAATRALVRALPGDPLETLIAESGTSIPAAQLRADLMLDRPFLPALVEDARRFAHGDFGTSLISRKPVAALVQQRFWKTLQLALLSFTLALAFSLFLGIRAAAKPGGPSDRICTFYGSFAAAVPVPWTGPIIMVAFCVWLPVFPTGGSVVLPAFTLAAAITGVWARLIRSRVTDSLRFGAVPGARARGLSEFTVLTKYAFIPAAGALVAYFGTQFGALLAGAFVVEIVFDWKGLGSLLIDAVLKRDYPVVEAATFLAASASLFGNAAGDWLQRRIDPRQRDLREST